ncbi:MAG: SGNH/GDSL hydrolase family protein [Bacteroidales bacterium]|nr:SGNH/GDSL hydrolase family protein [Bacteroidales bacterium]
MKHSLIFMLFLTVISISCDEKNEPIAVSNNGTNYNEDPPAENLSYLALGDSYTIGERVEISERFPVQLAERLQLMAYDLRDAEIMARTGWSTGQLLQAVADENPQGPYSLVSLLIGVNDQYRGLDISEYRQEFRQMLQKAIRLAGNNPKNVIVLSIPDYSVTPFASGADTARIARDIDTFNAANYDETKYLSANYFDITGISRKAKFNPELIAIDGLHPSGKMYSEWVDLILPKANEILQSQTKK